MDDVVDIKILPLRSWHAEFRADYIATDDYPRWFRYQEQLYSLRLMIRTKRTGWDFETVTTESNGTVFAAVLDEKTVKVGRIPHGAGDN
jgi:hypothetical protein